MCQISAELRTAVYERATGQCECTNTECGHSSSIRCETRLNGNWEVHRISAGTPYVLDYVIGLCQDCFLNTPDFAVSKN